MHYVDAYSTSGTTGLNSGPSGSNQTHAKNLLGATARVGHCVMVRFKQYYSYGTGNGTGYSYRGLYYVFKIVSLNANGVVNQWTNQSSGFR